jgi:hypothetical protein
MVAIAETENENLPSARPLLSDDEDGGNKAQALMKKEGNTPLSLKDKQ